MALTRAPPSQLPQPAPNAATGGGWSNPLRRASLYVGDLDPNVTEADLYNKFSVIAPIASFRLCRCLLTGKSLCYAYVNYFSHVHASKAIACLNHTELKGKQMRIMWCQRDPFPRKIGLANLFVKNLSPSVKSADLEGIFCRFGTILSCKIAEENGQSKGFGFVQFESEESAMAAITALHDTIFEGTKLYVSKFVKKSERTAAAEEEKFTNLYVKNLADTMTKDLLENLFSRFGKVCSVAIMKDNKGSSRGFGFVNFQSPDDAKKALEAMNGVQLGSKNLFVGRAQKKAERTKLLKHQYKDVLNYRFEKLKPLNLYVKNLAAYIDDKRLKELFGRFGKITSARVMCNEDGMSKRFGFVCFSTPEEAMAALNGLNGTFFEGKFLYVAVAQRKEDRLKKLQSYFMQNTPINSSYEATCNAVTPQFHPFNYFPPCPPLFPLPCQPTLYQHFVGNMDVQYPLQTFSYDLMRHMDPSNAGVRRNLLCGQHSMTYNSIVRNRELDHANSGSKKVGWMNKANKRCEPAENSSVQSVTAAASPINSKKNNENRTHLFVENHQPEHAGKITDVLLEIKNSDVLKLRSSPNSLAVKDKSDQVLKEANAMTSSDAVAFVNSKSARCLSY